MLTEKQAAERRLQALITRRLAEERDTIAPELHEFVVGNNTDEVEAAITLAKTKTQAILAGIRSAQARPDDADQVRFRADVQTGYGDRVPDVSGMSMREYEAYRKAAGIGQRADHGIFGPIKG